MISKIYPLLLLAVLFFACHPKPVVPGCTDPLAYNYDPDATIDDTSCCFQTIDTIPVSIFMKDPDMNNYVAQFKFKQVVTTYQPNKCGLDAYVAYLTIVNIDSTNQEKITFNYSGTFTSTSHNWSFNGTVSNLDYTSSDRIGIVSKKPTALDLGIIQISIDTVYYTP